MGSQTLRPTATVVNPGPWTATGGAGTLHGNTSDNSDASYISPPASNPLALPRLDVTDLSPIPTGAQIRSVTLRIRASGNSSQTFSAALGYVGYIVPGGIEKTTQVTAATRPSGSITTYTFQALTKDPFGQDWSSIGVNRLHVWLGGTGTSIRIYEVYVDVVYNEAPVVSSVTPSGSVTSGNPTIGWTFSDPENDAQQAWTVRVFDAATTGASSFSPDTSTPVWDSEDAYLGSAAVTSVPVGTTLAPGTYTAYVRASDAGSNLRWSSWASSSFTVVGSPPAPPVITAVLPDPNDLSVAIVVRATDNYLTSNQAQADDAGSVPLRWTGTAATVSQASSGVAGFGNSVRLVATGTGAMTVNESSGGVNGHVVTAGTTYAVVWRGHNNVGTRTARVDVRWFNAAGGLISTTTGTTQTPSSGAGVMSTFTQTMVAPANAATCDLVIVSGTGSTSDQMHIDDVSIRDTTDVTSGYRGGADSPNLLQYDDSSFETASVGGWATASGSHSVARGAAATAYAGQALIDTATTAGFLYITTNSRPVLLPVAEASYVFQAATQPSWASPSYVISLRVDWLDAAGNVVKLDFYSPSAITSTSFVTTGATFTAPPGAVYAKLYYTWFGNEANGDALRWDRFLFARLDSAAPAAVPMPYKPAPGTDRYARVEFSDDNGATWIPVRFTELSAYDPITRLATVYDIEPRPNAARQYRARTVVLDYLLDPTTGAAQASAPSSPSSGTLQFSGWWLIDPSSSPTRLRIVHTGETPLSSTEPQGRFAPLGRDREVILSDVAKGDQLPLRLFFADPADYDAFETVRRSGRVLYLVAPAPLSRSWYVKLGPQRVATVGQGAGFGTVLVTVDAIEVDRPAA